MRRLLYLPAILLLCALGCDSGNPVAPTGTVLTMTASSTQIGLNGSTLITVTGYRPDGNRLYPGTEIIFSLSGSTSSGGSSGSNDDGVVSNSGLVVQPNSDALGVIEPTVAEIDDTGKATAVFTSDGRAGSVTITAATTTGDASASVTVQIGETDATKPTLSITVNPSTIGLGETSTITVIARNADGSAYGAGGVVRLHTSLGTLEDEELVTDSDGEAQTTLEAGSEPGEATITGSIGPSDEVTATVTIENRKPSLIISANPSTIQANTIDEDTGYLKVTPDGEALITIIARNHNNVPLGAGHRIVLTADLGMVTSSSSVGIQGDPTPIQDVDTDSQGEARVYFAAGTRSGSGGVTAILGTSEPAETGITIEVAPASFTFIPDKYYVSSSGDSLQLTATVVDAEGRAASSILVRFESTAGGTYSPAASVTTDTRGVATTTITFTAADLSGREDLEVSATVRIGGEDQTQAETINVQ